MRSELKMKELNWFKKILFLLIGVSLLTACTANTSTKTKSELINNSENKTMIKKNIKATIKTNKGDIKLELYAQEAPQTVANFVKLARAGFYNDIKFHRVIGDFMIQTGDPQTRGKEGVDFVYDPNNNPQNLPIAGTGGPGYSFADEFSDKLHFDKAGVLAMANSGPNTNGSQFFITHVPTPWLNNKHTIFGQVVSGQDVVNAIERGDVIKEIIIE